MTNFEHYKDEIIKLTDDCEISSVEVLKKLHTEFKIQNLYARSLAYTFVEWGYAEYIEPYKLTKLEKFILENLNERAIYIEKLKGGYPWISGNGIALGCIVDYFPKATFNGLKGKGKCKIADILANCEVVD